MKLPAPVRIVLSALVLSAGWCDAASLTVTVLDSEGKPVPEVAIVALAGVAVATPGVTSPAAPVTAVMDQINLQFDPGVLVVARGTTVSFPNSDDVAHQVYSFSPAKHFALPLYRGQSSTPVTFDQTGIVILGCNIHDSMIGYVYVTDSPHFGKTDARGRISFPDLMPGTYRVTAWNPRFTEATPELVEQVVVGVEATTREIRLLRPMKPEPQQSKAKKLRY
jgi:plastocyanin